MSVTSYPFVTIDRQTVCLGFHLVVGELVCEDHLCWADGWPASELGLVAWPLHCGLAPSSAIEDLTSDSHPSVGIPSHLSSDS